MTNPDAQRRKERVALLSVISNAILVAAKLAIGIMIGAVSIISEAIHSAVDLAASIIAMFSVKTSSQPPDSEHPFGHGKIENVSGTIEAILIFVAAGWIIYEAVMKIIHPVILESPGWGVGVMLVSTIVNIVVSRMLFKVGKETDSIALIADAWHLRTDVYTSAGVMGTLAVIWGGERIFTGRHFDWLDPIAAIGVAILILKAAYDLTMQSAKDLLDAKLPAAEEEWIRQRIRKEEPSVHGVHQLRTRKSGQFRFVEFHMMVDPRMSVQASHDITDVLSDAIEKQFPDTSVTIHIEPCDGSCKPDCLKGCFLSEEKKSLQAKTQPGS